MRYSSRHAGVDHYEWSSPIKFKVRKNYILYLIDQAELLIVRKLIDLGAIILSNKWKMGH